MNYHRRNAGVGRMRNAAADDGQRPGWGQTERTDPGAIWPALGRAVRVQTARQPHESQSPPRLQKRRRGELLAGLRERASVYCNIVKYGRETGNSPMRASHGVANPNRNLIPHRCGPGPERMMKRRPGAVRPGRIARLPFDLRLGARPSEGKSARFRPCNWRRLHGSGESFTRSF